MSWTSSLLLSVALAMVSAGAVHASTFVYVLNSDDGSISVFTLLPDGSLLPGGRYEVGGKPAQAMTVSRDRRFLFAAVRSKPFRVVTFAIDGTTGALKRISEGPLAESLPYISVDESGRLLLGASYGGNVISVSRIGDGGIVAAPHQVMSVGRHAHSILTDHTGRWVFAAHLGSDQIFQFRLDKKTGTLVSNTPPAVLLKPGASPRHMVLSPDNRFVFVLSELTGRVTTLSLDVETGLLTEVGSAPTLPADSKLVPGQVRAPGAAGGELRDVSNDIWASDLHITPDGRFLYAAERTGSSIGGLSVDKATGKLTWLSSTTTEKQPRGFRIDSKGRYMVVAGEKSETISLYAIDGGTGALKLLRQYPTGHGACWVEIVDR